MSETKKGTICTLRPEGYGFIKPSGSNDNNDHIFFHASRLIDIKFNNLEPGMNVCYIENEGKKGLIAADIVIDYFEYADKETKMKILKDNKKH